MNVEAGKTYIGVVEDNKDPEKRGRVKVRVLGVYDSLKVEELPWAKPWKDLAGNAFNLPEVGKAVTVVFGTKEGSKDGVILADEYKPEFICSDAFNINLEKKLEQLSETDYLSTKALIFDHKTQVYVNDGEGLKLDHKFNLINIKDKSINVNLKDNFGTINLGTENSTQRAVLGDNFLNWFDSFLDILLGNTAFFGNLKAPIIISPALMECINIYKQNKNPKFLSKNVKIVDNEKISKLERIAEGQKGDSWQSNARENTLTTTEPVDYKASSGSTDTPVDTQAPQSESVGPSNPVPSPESGQVDPNQLPTSVSEATKSNPPQPQVDPDVEILKKLISSKDKYKLYTEPFKLNIIAIRNSCLNSRDEYPNVFDDKLYVMYTDDNAEWVLKSYSFSTLPGTEFIVTEGFIKSYLPKKRTADPNDPTKEVPYWSTIKNKKSYLKDFYRFEASNGVIPFGDIGIPILAPSQYIDVFVLSPSKNRLSTHPTSAQQVYIDKEYDKKTTFIPISTGSGSLSNPLKKNKSGTGNFGIGIGGTLSRPMFKVGLLSMTGHCFQNPDNMKEFFTLCEEHVKRHKNIFTYTLATKKDWDEAVAAYNLDAPDSVPEPVTPLSNPVDSSLSLSNLPTNPTTSPTQSTPQ